MRVVLTRAADGSFMITERPPVIAEVDATGKLDAYVAAGDSVGLRHFCSRGVLAALRESNGEAQIPKRLASVACELRLSLIAP